MDSSYLELINEELEVGKVYWVKIKGGKSFKAELIGRDNDKVIFRSFMHVISVHALDEIIYLEYVPQGFDI